MPTPPTVARPRFRPDIEGLRAVAILLVIGYHAGVPGFSGGYVGVDIFFVLSGYLITWLLVYEAEATGTINLASFYARRARRLLPALAVVLVTTVALGAIIYAPFEQRAVANTAAATAGYLSNIYFAIVATDYLGAAAGTNPLLHTWSLSVEEQFYIVWPLFVMLALGVLQWQRGSSSRRRLLAWMACVTALSLAISVYLTGVRQPWAFFSSPTRAWEFAAGAFGVLVPQGVLRTGALGRWQAALQRWPRWATVASTASMLGWIGLGGMLAAAVVFDESTTFPGFAALLPVLATVLVLRAGAATAASSTGRILGFRPFQEIGRLSYSWYLWHWPVLVFAEAVYGDLSLPARIALLSLSLVIAEASYRLVESPIRHGAWLTAHPRRSLVMAVCVACSGIAISFAWRGESVRWASSSAQQRYTRVRSEIPVIYSMGCHAPFEQADVTECTFGREDASLTALLIGDSHAAMWLPMIRPMVNRGGWRLVVMTKSACPMVALSYRNPRIGREYVECDRWRTAALRRITELAPDLTIVASYDHYPFTFEQWEAGQRSMLEALGGSSHRIVLLRDTPAPGFDVPACLARQDWWPHAFPHTRCTIDSGSNAPSVAYRAQREVVAGMANVSILDLNDHVCHDGVCNAVEDGMVVFRDTGHITRDFAGSLAGEFYDYVSHLQDGSALQYSGS